MIQPSIDKLLTKVGSKYLLVNLVSKRVKEIEETEEDIRSAKEKEQQIKDASMQETEKNNERKAAAYKKRDEANETISSQDEYIKEMLNSMKKEEPTESKKSK